MDVAKTDYGKDSRGIGKVGEMNKITQKDLFKLKKEKLAKHLEYFLARLSPGKRGEWIRQNIPKILEIKTKIKINGNQLLNDIENFIEERF